MMLNSFFPPSLASFLTEIEDLGFSLCLVGGAVRDYLSRGEISHDLDFEIRASQKINDEAWAAYYDRLIKFFENKKLKVTLFPYLITKIDFDGWSLEFSSPRLEVYEDQHLHTHHNFTAHLSSNLSYGESFKRRDFTLNAIGLELNCKKNSMKLIDSYQCEKDLKEKNLRCINEDFFKDSVRFLRLIRFSIKYQMTIDPSIEKSLASFNLSALSKYHFASEMFKTDPAKFLNCFRDFVKKYNLKLPSDYSIWMNDKIDWPINKFESKDDILIYVYLTQKEFALEVLKFFSLPEKKLRELNNLHSNKSKPNNDLMLKIKKFGELK